MIDPLEAERVNSAQRDVARYLEQLQYNVDHSNEITATAAELIAKIQRLESLYGPVAQKIVALALAGEREAAIDQLNSECQPLLDQLNVASAEYARYAESRAAVRQAAGAADFNAQRNRLVSICLLAFCAAAVAGVWIARTLSRALGSEPAVLNAAAHQVADGDLSEIANAGSIPADSVMSSLTVMQRSLARLVSEVRDAAQLIFNGSAEIATANADLSARTEEQASGLEQTAASMEEITTALKSTAESAQTAANLSILASNVARKGAQVVTNVVDTMGAIDASSQQIAQILRQHRGDRIPDEHSRTQCGRRGSPCRRPRQGIRGRSQRGAQLGAAQRCSCNGNQSVDRRFVGPGRQRLHARPPSRRNDGRNRREHRSRRENHQ